MFDKFAYRSMIFPWVTKNILIWLFYVYSPGKWEWFVFERGAEGFNNIILELSIILFSIVIHHHSTSTALAAQMYL